MSRFQAVLLMVLVTLLWSMAGVVTRQVEQAQGLTLTFWRSGFNAMALLVLVALMRSPRGVAQGLRQGGWPLWASGCCWAVMFTAFMWALTLTTVANVLVTMALGPLITAVLARWFLRERLTHATLVAVLVAGLGLAVMQWPALVAAGADLPEAHAAAGAIGRSDEASHAAGLLLALAVPVAGAVNWTLIRWAVALKSPAVAGAAEPDFLLSVLIGAVLSTGLAAWGANPAEASGADLAWLALLGVFQLAVPCLLAVQVARVLEPAEVALLSLLEVIFGVAWAWIGTAEQAQAPVVLGGAIVILTLVLHQAWTMRRKSPVVV